MIKLSVKEYIHNDTLTYVTITDANGVEWPVDWYIDEEDNLALIFPKGTYTVNHEKLERERIKSRLATEN